MKRSTRQVWMEAVWTDGDLTTNDKVVLFALWWHMDKDGLCWPGQKRLAEMTSLSRRTVQRIVARNVGKWLSVEHVNGRPNSYVALIPAPPGDAPLGASSSDAGGRHRRHKPAPASDARTVRTSNEHRALISKEGKTPSVVGELEMSTLDWKRNLDELAKLREFVGIDVQVVEAEPLGKGLRPGASIKLSPTVVLTAGTARVGVGAQMLEAVLLRVGEASGAGVSRPERARVDAQGADS